MKVSLYSVNNDVIKDMGILSKIGLALETTWSISEFVRFKKFLLRENPDVVHFHNFFPLISPSAYYACHSLNIPVVQTLHNYRLLCPAATFLRKNEICEKCLNGSILNSVKNGCYRDSVIQTLPVAAMIKFNNFIRTWNRKVDRYITLTEFAKKKFIEGGIPESKIVVKPNFIAQKEKMSKINEKENYILFVGRISKEKGVDILLSAWEKIFDKQGNKLLIVGDGPEKKLLEEQYNQHKDIEFLGKLNEDQVLTFMKKAKYLVVPSIWYEGFPMTIIEAFSVGTPVIASNIGSLQEVVVHGKNGFHFNYGDSNALKECLEMALKFNDYQDLIQNTFNIYPENKIWQKTTPT
ncbi:glycosyltransferase family 4 protein [Anoxybacillus flavithermus]|nr:glycosyltransferase family 4 protein [Anoxybacillus flavithermus]MBE2955272.1 glycosyltransferase family 4 protein [Anoxybacillus flavithermus]